MGNKLKIKTLPTPVEGLYVTPVVTPEAVQGDSIPNLPDNSAIDAKDLKAYLDKLEHYLADLKSKLDNRVVKIELPEWDSNKPTTTGVQTKHIADGAITNDKILSQKEIQKDGQTVLVGGISGEKIMKESITNDKIVPYSNGRGGIHGAKIQDNTISLDKVMFGGIDLIASDYEGKSNEDRVSFTETINGESVTTWWATEEEDKDIENYRILFLCVGQEGGAEGSTILATTIIPLACKEDSTNVFSCRYTESTDHTGFSYIARGKILKDTNNKKHVYICCESYLNHCRAVLYGIK